MIAFVIAALLANPTPVQTVAFRAPQPVMQTRAQASADQVPYSVAVTLECTAHASGRVSGCMVLGETDPGLGFGEAAIALMQDAEVAPGPRDVQFARTLQFVP